MTVPNRHGNTSDYRYGFQGQEMDDEVKGEGNSLNYTFRMHDPRVGRFFAVDPLTSVYPYLTPYQFSSNNPIGMVEIEGLEGMFSPIIPTDPDLFMTVEGREVSQQVLEAMTIDIPEGMLNGIVYTTTGVVRFIIGGVTYGYGYEKGGAGGGYKTMIQLNQYGYSYGDGFHIKKSGLQRADTPEDALIYFEGITSGIGLAEIGIIIKTAKKLNKTGSKLVSTTMLEANAKEYPSATTFGDPRGEFIAPSSEIDDLLSQGLSRNEIANKLGINDPRFLEGDLIRIDIDDTLAKELNLREPIGSESGANENYIPGGETSGGVTEKIVDGIPKKEVRVKVTKVKE